MFWLLHLQTTKYAHYSVIHWIFVDTVYQIFIPTPYVMCFVFNQDISLIIALFCFIFYFIYTITNLCDRVGCRTRVKKCFFFLPFLQLSFCLVFFFSSKRHCNLHKSIVTIILVEVSHGSSVTCIRRMFRK